MKRMYRIVFALLIAAGLILQSGGIAVKAESETARKPLTPVLVWPRGAITTKTPGFRWKPTPGATEEYYVVIQYIGNRMKYETTYLTVGTKYNCTKTMCVIHLTKPLHGGKWAPYRWRVTSKNPAGKSDPSDWMKFEVYTKN